VQRDALEETMLTNLKNVVKSMPPFRSIVNQRNALARQVAQLQEELAQQTKWGEPNYSHDGLRTYHKSLCFLKDESFLAAYRKGVATGGHKNTRLEDIHIEYRAHIVCWAGQHAMHLPGDFVECGVNRGCLAVTLCNFIDFNKTGKAFYLFDTFLGIPEEQMSETERPMFTEFSKYMYEECYEIAKQNFAPFPRAKLVRGMVPDTLTSVPIEKVCFLSIDMNIVAPELAAISYFWEKLVPGAIVIFDDYGWKSHYEQKKALDDFASRKGVSIATLPTGQGLLLKP
jgi:O-methyltransferase